MTKAEEMPVGLSAECERTDRVLRLVVHDRNVPVFREAVQVAVVHKFEDLRVSGFGQSGGKFVKRQLLILDVHALVFHVLDGQPDIGRNHIG